MTDTGPQTCAVSDPRLVLLQRAVGRCMLVELGEVSLDEGFDALVDPFMAIVAPPECPTCGAAPCVNPSFCRACEEADRRRKPAQHKQSFSRPTPTSTVEAIKQAVRDRGKPALKEPATRQRLDTCDPAARADLRAWLKARESK